MKELTAVYPGTFDPVTNGHLDIIRRGAAVCSPKVIVAILINADKAPLSASRSAAAMVAGATSELRNVRVDTFEGLLVTTRAARVRGVIVRGLRAVSDFEYELQMAMMNRRIRTTQSRRVHDAQRVLLLRVLAAGPRGRDAGRNRGRPRSRRCRPGALFRLRGKP